MTEVLRVTELKVQRGIAAAGPYLEPGQLLGNLGGQ